jgi:hypothetical protein
MNIYKFPLGPPSLEELAQKLKPALEQNYNHSSISVVQTCANPPST